MQAAEIKKVLDETMKVVDVGMSNKETALREKIEKLEGKTNH